MGDETGEKVAQKTHLSTGSPGHGLKDWGAPMLLWTIVSLGVAAYCLARGILDIRQQRYVWAVLGMAAAAAILLTPVQTHAVKLDLPMPARD